jgi:hypothetical protein
LELNISGLFSFMSFSFSRHFSSQAKDISFFTGISVIGQKNDYRKSQ